MDVKKIQAAIEQLKQGGLVIVMDDLDREAEGDLVGLASKATPAKVNFMTKHARGLMCVPMAPAVADRLELRQMTVDNTDPFGTAFTISVDHHSTTTGISAFDRCRTISIWRIRLPGTLIFISRGIFSHWLPRLAGCWNGTVTPRRRSTSLN